MSIQALSKNLLTLWFLLTACLKSVLVGGVAWNEAGFWPSLPAQRLWDSKNWPVCYGLYWTSLFLSCFFPRGFLMFFNGSLMFLFFSQGFLMVFKQFFGQTMIFPLKQYLSKDFWQQIDQPFFHGSLRTWSEPRCQEHGHGREQEVVSEQRRDYSDLTEGLGFW